MTTPHLVLDCSVTLAWCFENEQTAYTEGVLRTLGDGQAIVPAIWPLEVANALVVNERRNRLTQAETTHFLAILRALPIVVDEETTRHALAASLVLARQYNLTTYDAAYLELAMRRRYPLATLDLPLRRAAEDAGVAVLTEATLPT